MNRLDNGLQNISIAWGDREAEKTLPATCSGNEKHVAVTEKSNNCFEQLFKLKTNTGQASVDVKKKASSQVVGIARKKVVEALEFCFVEVQRGAVLKVGIMPLLLNIWRRL